MPQSHSHSLEWWRPEAAAPASRPAPAPADATPLASGRLAFGALSAFMAILILAPQDIVPALAPLRLARLTAVTAIGAYLVHRWLHAADAGPMPRAFVLAGALVAWAIVTIPLSIWPGGSVSLLTELYLKAVAVFWLLGSVLTTTGRLRTMLWLQTLCTIPLALTSLMQYGGGAAGPDGAGRIAGYGDGLAGNPNDLALVLALTIPLTAALASSAASRVARLLATTILGMGIVAVMATFSRAGFVALVVVGMLWLAAQLRRRPLRAVGALVLAATLAWAMVPAGYGARLTTMTDIESDPTGSAQERWRDMGVATSYMLDHPVVGAGLGMDILALNELRGATWRRVHNAYLNYGVDLGLPGLGLFLLLLWTVIRGVRRVERRDAAGELGALAGGLRIALVTFAVAAFFYPVAYHFYFYSLAGMAVAAVRIERTRGVPAARAGSESRHG